MATVKLYYRCMHCGTIISITKSDKTKLSNLILCPSCNKNIFK